MSNYSKIWTILDAFFQQNPDDAAGKVEKREIEEAEYALGLKFSEDYKRFLLSYGGALIGSDLVYGLRKQRFMGNELSDVVKITKFYRDQNWPETDKWYIVSDDFDGNPIGIDKEGSAWLSDHDCGFELVKLADSFEELLYRLHTDTLFSD